LIIFRYLAKQVLVSMLAVTFILLLVFMSGRFIKYLAKAASGGISPDILFSIMAYRLPGFLELILPLGFFIGILLAYGRMYLESEMTVLHACGYSNRRLLMVTLGYSCIVAVFVGALSLFFTPLGMQKVGSLLHEQSKLTKFEMLFPGTFQSFKSGASTTYAESLSDDKKTMFNVFISEKSEKNNTHNLVYAESGNQRIDKQTGERFLELHNGTSYQGSPGMLDYHVVEFESYGMLIEESNEEQGVVKAEAITTLELWQATDLKSKALLQWRISLPLLVPIVTLLAVSVSRVNPRQGRFFHLFPAMMMYVGYLGLLIVARKSVGKGELPVWLGLWGVHLLFFLLSLILLTKDQWLSKLRRKRFMLEAKNA
jgi:lipopolysaccharide export system permease protein